MADDLRWVFFGDSLTDNGLFGALASEFTTIKVPFEAGGYSDSFTNGDVYADTWMERAQTAPENYINLALGSAQARGQQPVQVLIDEYAAAGLVKPDADFIVSDPSSPFVGQDISGWDMNLGGQVDRYLTYFPDDPNLTTVASIFIGANDLLDFEFDFFDWVFGSQKKDFASSITSEVEDAARELLGAGVDKIILHTMPIAQTVPGFDDLNGIEESVTSALVDQISLSIRARADDLRADGHDVDVVRVDLITQEVIRDRDAFGFATDESLILGTSKPDFQAQGDGTFLPVFTPNPDAGDWRIDQRMFFDEIHPTEALHDVMGIFAHESTSTEDVWLSDGSNNFTGTMTHDFVLARDGNDTVILAKGADTALGGRGNDTLEGLNGSDLLIGGAGDDYVHGGRGWDVIVGSEGQDELRGGRGRDIIIGGTDGDILFGGADADHFIWVDPTLTAADETAGGTIYGGALDTLWLVMAGLTAADGIVRGGLADAEAAGLTVNGVEQVKLIGYDTLDTLEFTGILDLRYDEAQLWGVI